MFRDLKEYQEIQKLYEEKVSKSENLDEQVAGSGNVRGANMKGSINLGNMFKKIGDALKPKPTLGSRSRFNKPKVTDTSSEIESDANYAKSNARFNQRFKDANTDTSKEIESSSAEFKANEGDKVNQRFNRDVGIVRRSQMTGKQRAQELAKKRIGSGTAKNPETTIAQVNQRNRESMRARAAERNKKFQAAKREGPEAMKKYREENPKLSGRERAQQMAKERIAARRRLSNANINVEDYTPDAYDLVLEYLLSSEQVATIEEANYVMTEMNAQTIQSIVEEQKKNLDEKFGGLGKITLGQIGSTLTKGALGYGAYKLAFGGKGNKTDTNTNTTTPNVNVNVNKDKNKKKDNKEDLLKQGIDVINQAKENPNTGLNPNTRKALELMKQYEKGY